MPEIAGRLSLRRRYKGLKDNQESESARRDREAEISMTDGNSLVFTRSELRDLNRHQSKQRYAVDRRNNVI